MNLYTKRFTLSILTALSVTSTKAEESPNEVAEQLIEEGQQKSTINSSSKVTLSNELIRKQQLYLEATIHLQRAEKLLATQNYKEVNAEIDSVKSLILSFKDPILTCGLSSS